MEKKLTKNTAFFAAAVLIILQSCSGISRQEPNGLDRVISKIDKRFEEKIEDNVPGAVVLFIQDGQVYYRRAFGYSDWDNREPMTPDAVFQVASISKSLSAIGIMKLVEDGYIELDDPVENYLTRWRFPPSAYNSQNVTFRRLLSHTAGVSNTEMPVGYPPDIGLPAIEQELMGNPGSIYAEHYSFPVVLENEPGQMWKYSNAGYGILQLAAEEIRRLSFSEYMRFYIMEPMNMLNSSYRYHSGLYEKLTNSYLHVVIEAPRFILANEAAVGLYSTADDLAVLLIEIMNCYHGEPNNFVLTRDTLSLMLGPQADFEVGFYDSMGLGFFIHNAGKHRKTYGHTGSALGWKVAYEFCPDTREGIIVLANGTMGEAHAIRPLLLAWREYVGSR